MLRPSRASSLVALLALFGAARAAAQVVLEQADKAPGLAAADEVVGWELRDAAGELVEAGPIDDPFVLLAVLRDRIARGPLSLRRASGETVLVPPHGYRLRGEPRLPPAELATFRATVTLLAAESSESKAQGREQLRSLLATTTEPLLRAWLSYRLALALETAREWPAASETLAAALETPGLPPLHEALLLSRLWRTFTERRLPAEALPIAERALRALDGSTEWPVLAANLRAEHANSLRTLGRLVEAEEGYAASLAVLGELAAVSHEHAWVLTHAASSAWLADDLDLADQRDRRALAIHERLGLPIHVLLNDLATNAHSRGQWSEAEQLYYRAIEANPDDRNRAQTRSNLAALFRRRGELERAQTLYHEIVAFYETSDDPRNAFDLADTLAGLAAVERQLGDHDAAERHARRAVSAHLERAPDSIGAADSLRNLGEVLYAAGKLAEASTVLAQSLAAAERARPGGLVAADARMTLAAIALGRDELAAAEQQYRQVLDVARALTVDHRLQAEALHGLGRVEAARGNRLAARQHFLAAVDHLESLRGKLGGAHEARAGFTSVHQQLYWAALDSVAAEGLAAEAFLLAERYRAQSLLALLAERDLDFSADLSPALDRERRRLAAHYDSLLAKVAHAAAEERPALRQQMQQVRQQQQELEDRLRATSARLAALVDPPALDAATTARLLPAGTLLLSYLLGDERSWLLAIGPGGSEITAYPLAAGLDPLRDAVQRFRELATDPTSRGAERLQAAGEAMTRLLLSPVAARLAAADHLLLLPDGPLHLLPWAALPEPGGEEPLIARRAVSLAASATLLRELREREAAAPQSLVAFGDPLRPGTDSAVTQVALRSGATLGPLAGARDEVLDIGELFDVDSGAGIFLAADATEAKVLEQAPRGRRLHLACHALVDPDVPLESGLLLAPPAAGEPAGGNGFLQAWEIYQGLRLDADLVTLSACDTGLGREMAGEGVLGLTRAFHFAGARTVVSSLWRVADRSTAELMLSFYRHLLAGRSKAEALRQAQLELSRGATPSGEPARRPPFYWAAFQVHGAWD